MTRNPGVAFTAFTNFIRIAGFPPATMTVMSGTQFSYFGEPWSRRAAS